MYKNCVKSCPNPLYYYQWHSNGAKGTINAHKELNLQRLQASGVSISSSNLCVLDKVKLRSSAMILRKKKQWNYTTPRCKHLASFIFIEDESFSWKFLKRNSNFNQILPQEKDIRIYKYLLLFFIYLFIF